jgi:hypothetical protein
VPLILDPARYSDGALEALAREFAESLREVREMVDSPRGRVLDPASLEAARALLDASLAAVDPPASGDKARLAAQVNLGYAAMVAAIDLVKSHTDVPRVPPPRPVPKE